MKQVAYLKRASIKVRNALNFFYFMAFRESGSTRNIRLITLEYLAAQVPSDRFVLLATIQDVSVVPLGNLPGRLFPFVPNAAY